MGVSNCQVKLAVVVEITYCNPMWKLLYRVVGVLLEGTVAVAEQNTDGVIGKIASSQVGIAIAIEVCHRERLRNPAYRYLLRRCEGSIPVARQYANRLPK